jgi:hypothetical protein
MIRNWKSSRLLAILFLFLEQGRWINKLESLGLSVKKINELDDLHEIRDLAEIIKQSL